MSDHRLRRSCAGLALMAGLFVFSGETCGSPEKGCDTEPAGYVNVFFRTGPSMEPRSVTAAIVSIDEAEHTIALRDSSGAADTLYLDVPGHALPLRTGRTYTFEVEYAPGFPSLSGIMVSDPAGLLLAGVTDRESSPRIFKSGIPGFSVSLRDSDCPDRNADPCYDSIRNATLAVMRGSETVVLKNSEAARLGDFDITCLAAQRVDYSSSCADAGLPSYSFILIRRDARPNTDGN